MTKMAKIDTLFLTKSAEEHTLCGRTYLYRPFKEDHDGTIDRKPRRFRISKCLARLNMIGINSVVSEWKENFRLSQPNPSLFCGILRLVVKAANSLLTISSSMFPELSSCVNGQESEYSITVESRNINESGKISSSVNLV